jgi:hypothetical protein
MNKKFAIAGLRLPALIMFSAVLMLLTLSGCSPKNAEEKPEPQNEETFLAEEPEPAIPDEILETPQEEGAVALNEDFMESIDDAAQGPLGQIYIDVSSMENLQKCLEEMGKEIQKLSPEEQKKAREGFVRYMLDTFKSYPDRHEFMPPNQPSPEAVEKFVFYAAQPFDGKNFYDFMEDAEIRAQGRPTLEEEMRAFTEGMMQQQ